MEMSGYKGDSQMTIIPVGIKALTLDADETAKVFVVLKVYCENMAAQVDPQISAMYKQLKAIYETE